jgi:transglutaminase-like putative cysteine protease
MPGSLYWVEHETRDLHSRRASTSRHVACLKPRPSPRQTLQEHDLTVEPTPDEMSERIDYFGNTLHHFAIMAPYVEMRVLSRSVVDVRARGQEIDPDAGPSWEEVEQQEHFKRGRPVHTDAQYRHASPFINFDESLASYARPSFVPGRPFVAAAVDLMHRIHGEFRFDPGATTIKTPVTRVLAERHGVCQDFAHLMIGCVRSLGLPARYVSGYLLTDPPPGQARLVGADASHAWLSVRDPQLGWIDLDPTNDVLPDRRHVTVAWGRDYGDVSPLRGVVLGGQHQTLHVGVSVIPMGDDDS